MTCKDAAGGPHVDAGRVKLGTEQHVWRAVPQSHDLGRITPGTHFKRYFSVSIV
jgi:hypothetical protein